MQLLNLTYNSWGEQLIRELNTMRSTNDMCDVKLVLKEEVLEAHSCVLAATSPFFKSIFSAAEHFEINLEDFPSRIVMHVLDFIYTGTSLFPKDDLELLHSVSTTLNIPGLIDLTQEMMLHSIPEETFENEPDAGNVILVEPTTNVTETLSNCSEEHSLVNLSCRLKVTAVIDDEFMPELENQTNDENVSVVKEEFITKLDNPMQVTEEFVPEECHKENESVTQEGYAVESETQTDNSGAGGMVSVINPKNVAQLKNVQHSSILTSNVQDTEANESVQPSNIIISSQSDDEAIYYETIQSDQNTNTITLVVKTEGDTITEKSECQTGNVTYHEMEVLYVAENESSDDTPNDMPCQDGIQPMVCADMIKSEAIISHPVSKEQRKLLPSTLVHVKDKEVPGDGSVQNRALKTLPDDLTVDISGVNKTENGVYATVSYPKGSLFGPYEGEVFEDSECSDKTEGRYCWKIYKDGKAIHWLEGENESKANWMRYVQRADNACQQNMEAFQNDGMLYFKASKEIQQYSELIVKYGNPQCSVLVTEDNTSGTAMDKISGDCGAVLKCEFCNILYTSEVIYHRHMRLKHCMGIPLQLYDMMQKKKPLKANTKEIREDNEITEQEHKHSDKIIGSPIELRSEQHKVVQPFPSKMKTRCVAKREYANNPVRDFMKSTKISDENKVTRRRRTKSIMKKQLICSVCDKSFISVGNLEKHELIHSNERPHSCPTCGRAFTQKCNMVAHMKTHTDNKTYVCPHCGKGFYRQSELRKHEKFHSDETPYVCTNCGKGFKEVGNFKRHLRSHTGEKPYRCPICARDFSRCENLKTHMRRHTGEKPFQCSLCGNCFSENAHLQTHMRRHTGEKPFHCSVCEKSFVDITGLSAHFKKHLKKKKQ